jgi:iron complex outermembrane recepter protein
MSNTTKLAGAIKFALFVGAASSVASVSAFAQEKEDEAKSLDRVEVTGSRIKRADVEGSQPVFTMDRAAIQAQGLTSIGDVIQNLTANGSTLNTTFNNGGNGETRVSLRNLGSGRTLVLVNGRRWVGGTGLGGAVDLNTIPTAAVERIDVLKDGASTLYGSDAIAGVVNVILKRDYEGAEANVYYGQFDENDGQREAYDVTIGAVGADGRFSGMLGASYVEEMPVWAGDREISAFPEFGTGTTFGSSTTPYGRFQVCRGRFDTTTGGCFVTVDGTDTGDFFLNDLGNRVAARQDRPDGTSGQFTFDPGQQGANWRNWNSANDFYFAPLNYLLTPQERISTFARGRFQITDNVAFDAQLTYNNRKSEQLLAAMPVVLGTGPGAGTQARTVKISKYNEYNVYGIDISRTQRRAIETGGRSFKQNVDTFGFSGALEGSFEIGDRFFSWDAGMVYANNDQNDTTDGLFNVAALRNALGPSKDGQCYTTATPGANPGDPVVYSGLIAGCVPLNLLGAVGTLTPEALAYSTFVAHDTYGYKMQQYFANISGDIVELPGGMMSFAAGLEHRVESGFDSPDALINSGNTTGNARTATEGEYSLNEAYLELAVPLLKDVFMAETLELSLATRYSDYSNFGSTTNNKVGFKWKPIESLLIRGNWSEGFRAPSINELYQGQSDSFPQVSDPCNDNLFGSQDAESQQRCIDQGVPDGGYDQGNPQIRVTVGGNPNLTPETSESSTLGFVWSPTQSFDVSLDWWKIDLENAITSFGADFILDQCIIEDLANFCALYTRGPSGEIDELLSVNLNLGKQTVEGYDMTLNYRVELGDYGKLSFNWDTTYMANNESDNNADGTINGDDGGSIVGLYQDRNNNWEYRSNLMTTWTMGDIGATWSTRFYSDQVETCDDYEYYGYADLCSDPNDDYFDADGEPVGPTGTNHIGATTYHDLSFFYSTPWKGKFTVGLNNAFAKDPPRSVSTFANSFDPQYEVPGRFWYMRYEQKF